MQSLLESNLKTLTANQKQNKCLGSE